MADITITNPIVLGEAVDDKEFHLDVSAVLNDSAKLNLEMQAVGKLDWRDRSLVYVCRAFDQLNHGDLYSRTKGVIQISFTDFALFPEAPAFYSTYKLINEKRPDQAYTDKLVISNIDLTSIGLATGEDRKWGIDRWARIFKAESWEDLQMIAAENKSADQAVSSIWQLTEDEKIREQIRRREENEREYNYVVQRARQADELEKALEKALAESEKQADELEKALADKDEKLAYKDEKLADQERIILELRAELARKEK